LIRLNINKSSWKSLRKIFHCKIYQTENQQSHDSFKGTDHHVH